MHNQNIREIKELFDTALQFADLLNEYICENESESLRKNSIVSIGNLICYATYDLEKHAEYMKYLSYVMDLTKDMIFDPIKPSVPRIFDALYEYSQRSTEYLYNPAPIYDAFASVCLFYFEEFAKNECPIQNQLILMDYLNEIIAFCENKGVVIENRPKLVSAKDNEEVSVSYLKAFDLYRSYFKITDAPEKNILDMWSYFDNKENNNDMKRKGCINIVALLGLVSGTLSLNNIMVRENKKNENLCFNANYSLIERYKIDAWNGVKYSIKNALCDYFDLVKKSYSHKDVSATKIATNILKINFELGFEIFSWVLQNFAQKIKDSDEDEQFIDDIMYFAVSEENIREQFVEKIITDKTLLLSAFQLEKEWNYGIIGLICCFLKNKEYIVVDNILKIYVEKLDIQKQNLDEVLKGIISRSSIYESSRGFSINQETYELLFKYVNMIGEEINRETTLQELRDKYKRYSDYTNYKNNIKPKEVKLAKKVFFNPDMDENFDFSRCKEKTVNERKENSIWENGKFLDFTSVVGFVFRPKEDRERILKTMRIGDKWRLEREPDNEHDALAIKVLDKNSIKVGYIPKTGNTILSTLMDSGQKLFARLNAFGAKGNNLEIAIEVFLEI